ncbi:MAG: MOSC domain-containing protein [Elusimicrobia bacterium CG11_big_fil_rev_8_21_14_0_20_64_6]|nr:MAG: MOSC domain-containing protein [Elusimicrobia bacterium CG11_big_fil_rev_8_21_14_0_20_64_6]
MEIVSICVGPSRRIPWRGETVATAIFKGPVETASIGKLGLAGDEQADLAVHGGPDKAVYAYSADHYPWWKEQLPGAELPYGAFGENLTIAGFADADVCLGDCYLSGSALLTAVQPRLPCSKLGLRFNDPGMVKRFAQSLRLGVYFRVTKPGRVRRGDAFEKVSEHKIRFPVLELARLYFDEALTADKARFALEHPELNKNWREMLGKRLPKP